MNGTAWGKEMQKKLGRPEVEDATILVWEREEREKGEEMTCWAAGHGPHEGLSCQTRAGERQGRRKGEGREGRREGGRKER